MGRVVLLCAKLVLIVHLAYIAATSSLIFLYKFINPPAIVLMPYRSIGYGWKLTKPQPLPLGRIPSYLRTMLVAVEDGKFYTHRGIDLEAFKRAREINARLGRPLYGGSTLTMQVARTLFLVPEKSYLRKYFEVIAALELELILSKERILELYFGYAEWGKGIFGIEAASRHYFTTSVANLTKDQGARLIALLSSPIKYTPSTLYKSAILRERYSYLVRRFVAPPVPASIPAAETMVKEIFPGSLEPGAEETGEAIEAGTSEPDAIASDPVAADAAPPNAPSGETTGSALSASP
ncbi:MAG: monofunctional biosynthetic peptidoglycan transglycosylase [Spirochaetes bacterium]|nr:MAG: monofunctional biosynthetic peptidoglycan transglycosylase [Spirochaetota bacterium]